jgi:hypothetical protein
MQNTAYRLFHYKYSSKAVKEIAKRLFQPTAYSITYLCRIAEFVNTSFLGALLEQSRNASS